MGEWTTRLIESRTTHAVELAARFAEERQRVLAENVANIDTPDHHSRTLDAASFQKSLSRALHAARERGSARVELQGNSQARTDPHGRLRVDPGREPAPNVLFHDGTNARLDALLSDASQNSLTYNVATQLLKNRFDGLLNAIRGRVS